MARLAYLGTPEAAVPPLRALAAAGHEIALVVSQPDRRRGRGSALLATPVKRAASSLGIRVSDRLEDAIAVGAQLGVVTAYGRIVPTRVLDALDMINLHFSLLPRWRGAAPVERAILAGDDETGVSVMRLEAGLDTGPVLASCRLAIDNAAREHASALTARLAAAAARLVVETLSAGVTALGPGEPQRGEATYAPKIGAAELHLEWSAPAAALERVVRLDGAWTTFRGERLRVRRARATSWHGGDDPPGTLHDTIVRAGDGALALEEVQVAGRRVVTADEWRRGVRPRAGELLGVHQAPGGASQGDR